MKTLFYADFFHLGLAEVFALAAFQPKSSRNERNEIENKTLGNTLTGNGNCMWSGS